MLCSRPSGTFSTLLSFLRRGGVVSLSLIISNLPVLAVSDSGPNAADPHVCLLPIAVALYSISISTSFCRNDCLESGFRFVLQAAATRSKIGVRSQVASW